MARHVHVPLDGAGAQAAIKVEPTMLSFGTVLVGNPSPPQNVTITNAGGAEVTEVITQGEWLERVGIRARADVLAAANPEKAEAVYTALRRLTTAGEMGGLFKVIALHSAGWPPPAGFE